MQNLASKKATQEKYRQESDGQRRDDIKEIARLNPFAAGQVLIRNPEYAGLMCEAINAVNADDKSDARMEQAFVVGTAILGGALLLTGVGTVAGAYILTGSITAGIAAGTVGGSILAYTTLAGSAVELTAAGYYGKKSYDSYIEMNRLESAYLTRNTDARAIVEAKDSLVAFKEARLSATISLANVGLSFLSLGKLFSLTQNAKELATPAEIKAASRILTALSDSVVAKRLKDMLSSLGNLAGEKIDKFLLYLAKAGEKVRVQFLTLLKDSSISPQKLKEAVEVALEAAKNC